MDDGEIEGLLARINAGEDGALDSLIGLVYGELRRMARGLMRGQPSQTLQPTALVNEAYLRLLGGEQRWENRAHFFGAAARAMRQVLIAHARRRSAAKRGGARRVTFADLDVQAPDPDLDVLALDGALTALAAVNERYVRVMELRYFAGCTLEEIARNTGRSLATVKRDWTYARAWLYDHMRR